METTYHTATAYAVISAKIVAFETRTGKEASASLYSKLFALEDTLRIFGGFR